MQHFRTRCLAWAGNHTAFRLVLSGTGQAHCSEMVTFHTGMRSCHDTRTGMPWQSHDLVINVMEHHVNLFLGNSYFTIHY